MEFQVKQKFLKQISEVSNPTMMACTTTEVIPTIEMISATEVTPNHHWNDTYLQ